MKSSSNILDDKALESWKFMPEVRNIQRENRGHLKGVGFISAGDQMALFALTGMFIFPGLEGH